MTMKNQKTNENHAHTCMHTCIPTCTHKVRLYASSGQKTVTNVTPSDLWSMLHEISTYIGMDTYIHTNIHTYTHTYIHTYTNQAPGHENC
jgi:hypothetical protein